MAGSIENQSSSEGQTWRETRVLPVNLKEVGNFHFDEPKHGFLGDWSFELNSASPHAPHLCKAAQHLREADVPVAFPTETVYGLGADATRSSAVRGIYTAKQRPADNPLIVHISSLSQLRGLLSPRKQNSTLDAIGNDSRGFPKDPIPAIYRPLIQRFWPGPLTILLPNPKDSILAPEVTAGLPTFGARMPSSNLALALIKLAGVPLAAPSANASTKPSPTTAQHVKHDLDGRIEIILDGGPCDVGVESTVVDGLSDPPMILRPGGVSIELLRECEGWKDVAVGYKDSSEKGKTPKAPGMKYKHYSPSAKVVLIEAGVGGGQFESSILTPYLDDGAKSIGIVRTKRWKPLSQGYHNQNGRINGLLKGMSNGTIQAQDEDLKQTNGSHPRGPTTSLPPNTGHPIPAAIKLAINLPATVWDLALGASTADIARGLFSALRELDQKNVDIIFVEGIDDAEGDAAAAVMNRLRKAAEVEVKS